MHIFYSGAKGFSDPELNRLVEEIIPGLLTQRGHSVYVLLHDPKTQEQSKGFDQIAKQILSADAFIGEMSRASQTLGFELSYALNNTKPCLYLYHHTRNAQPGTVMLNNPSRLLKIKPYTDTNLEDTLDSFLAFSEVQSNTSRTSFMSTRKIDTFLNQESKSRGISKGELIREILSERADRNDKSLS